MNEPQNNDEGHSHLYQEPPRPPITLTPEEVAATPEAQTPVAESTLTVTPEDVSRVSNPDEGTLSITPDQLPPTPEVPTIRPEDLPPET